MSNVKATGRSKDDIEFDNNFKPAIPAATLTASRGITTVTTKLFGPLSDDRKAAEQRMVEHRADQLNPVPKRPERIERERAQEFDEEGRPVRRVRRERE